MTVLMVERVSASLRGELTRWMIEPKTGVFVGKLSAMVRDRLWAKVCASKGAGSALLLHSSDSEQGYVMEVHGTRDRVVRDFEGLQLIQIQ